MNYHARVHDARIDDAFVLPMDGLFADLDAGAGALQLPDDFAEAPASAQLQVLKDWASALERAREQAFVSLYREIAAANPRQPPPVHLSMFHRACAELGMECQKIHVLLQEDV